jgi:hypothetical protein
MESSHSPTMEPSSHMASSLETAGEACMHLVMRLRIMESSHSSMMEQSAHLLASPLETPGETYMVEGDRCCKYRNQRALELLLA